MGDGAWMSMDEHEGAWMRMDGHVRLHLQYISVTLVSH